MSDASCYDPPVDVVHYKTIHGTPATTVTLASGCRVDLGTDPDGSLARAAAVGLVPQDPFLDEYARWGRTRYGTPMTTENGAETARARAFLRLLVDSLDAIPLTAPGLTATHPASVAVLQLARYIDQTLDYVDRINAAYRSATDLADALPTPPSPTPER